MDLKFAKLPNSAKALYTKLYCRKHNYDENNKRRKKHERINVIGANKSWQSLSKAEKKLFEKKLQKYRKEYKKNFAEYLKNVEAYMKKKRKGGDLSTQHETEATEANEENIAIEENGKNTEEMNSINRVETSNQDQPDNRDSDHETPNTTSQWQDQPDHRDMDHGTANLTDPQPCPPAISINDLLDQLDPEVPEPNPPIVKTAEELFRLVQSSEGGDKSWVTLTKLEKKRYRTTVLALKKNYIQKYKAYLESLTPEDLQEYYVKKFCT